MNLNDLSLFCAHGSSVLRVDTTFEIIDNLWLADTSFNSESLINENTNHADFPGPCTVSFRKDREAYQRFAVESTAAELSLLELKKVGTDLDSALFKGFGNIFQISDAYKCVEITTNLRNLMHLRVTKKKYYAIFMEVCKIRFIDQV